MVMDHLQREFCRHPRIFKRRGESGVVIGIRRHDQSEAFCKPTIALYTGDMFNMRKIEYVSDCALILLV